MQSRTALARQPLSAADWKLVLLLAAINFTHILDFVIVMPLGDRLRDELQISPQEFGFVVSAYGIAAMVAGILAATVIDRFDRKPILLIAFAGFTLATLYCGFAPNYLHLLTARSLAGMCGGIVSSSIMAFIMDLIADERRGRAIGVVTSSFAFASIIGLPIGLKLASRFDHFGAPFLAIALLGVFVWGLAAAVLPRLPPHQTSEPRVHPFAQFGVVVRQANHVWSFVFMLAMVFSTFMIVPYIAPYLEANCGISREHLPLIYAVAGALSLFVMNLSGWLTDRFGARPIFLMTAGGAIVMTLIVTHLPFIPLWLAMVVTSGFMSLASSRVVPAQAMMMRAADPKLRGAFTSLNTAVSHFATGVAPLISGLIIGEVTPGGL